MARVVLFGATGYTGRLVAEAMVARGMQPVLAARGRERLEQMARQRGFAIGSASALPVSIERIAQWARGLEARGVLLVPVSSAFAQGERR